MIPSMLKLRNIADDMHDYWCDRGYFRIDPVQIVAARSSAPFAWSYDEGSTPRSARSLTKTTEPVARYLRERDLDQWRDHPHPYAARRLCHRHRHPVRFERRG